MMTIMVMTAAKTTNPPNTPSAMMPPMFSLGPCFELEPDLIDELSAISLSNGFNKYGFLVVLSTGRLVVVDEAELLDVSDVDFLVLVDE